MINFEWPLLFLLLPLPWLARRLLSPSRPQQTAALRVPDLAEYEQTEQHGYLEKHHRWPLLLAGLAWALLVCAGARPQWVGDAIELPISGRDLILAVDLSESMQEQDFVLNGHAVDRLTATKKVAGDFIQRRVGDRIGLVLFGEQAYVQTPLSFDRQTVYTLLLESAIGLAGRRTAIGDAIGLAIKRFHHNNDTETPDNSAQSRVLILLTDGANTAGEVEPVQAAELAAQLGLKIYSIGIGAEEAYRRSFFGMHKYNPSADLDEKTLKALADKTAGRYFRARNLNELEEIYALLDELEPVEKDKESFRPTAALFHWPLAAALILFSILLINSAIRGRL